MNISNDREVIIGLFEDDKEAMQAIHHLHEHRFSKEDGDEIRVLDQSCLHLETSTQESSRKVVVQQGETTPSSDTAVVFDPMSGVRIASEIIERGAEAALVDLGIGPQEASIYAREIADGAILVTVETHQARVSEASNILGSMAKWVPKLEAKRGSQVK